MRLVSCSACRRPIRARATSCPFCAAKVRQADGPGLAAAAALGVGLLVSPGDAAAATSTGEVASSSGGSSSSGAGDTTGSGGAETDGVSGSTSGTGTGATAETEAPPIAEPHYGTPAGPSCSVGEAGGPASLAGLGLLMFARRRRRD